MKINEQLRVRSKVNERLKRLLTHLSTGRAYTLIELSKKTKTSKRKAREILKDLRSMEVVQIRRNRKRTYYYIPEPLKMDYIKALAKSPEATGKFPKGIKYSRHCYNHLAGYIGVKLEEALVHRKLLIRKQKDNDYGYYKVTPEGWEWFSNFGIQKSNLVKKGSRLTKQCLDFSERKSHLGGKLGDALLHELIQKGWVSSLPGSREIHFTEIGKKKMQKELGIEFTAAH